MRRVSLRHFPTRWKSSVSTASEVRSERAVAETWQANLVPPIDLSRIARIGPYRPAFQPPFSGHTCGQKNFAHCFAGRVPARRLPDEKLPIHFSAERVVLPALRRSNIHRVLGQPLFRRHSSTFARELAQPRGTLQIAFSAADNRQLLDFGLHVLQCSAFLGRTAIDDSTLLRAGAARQNRGAWIFRCRRMLSVVEAAALAPAAAACCVLFMLQRRADKRPRTRDAASSWLRF